MCRCSDGKVEAVFADAKRAFQCIGVEAEVLKLWSALLFFKAEDEVVALVNVSLEVEVVALINVSLVLLNKRLYVNLKLCVVV